MKPSRTVQVYKVCPQSLARLDGSGVDSSSSNDSSSSRSDSSSSSSSSSRSDSSSSGSSSGRSDSGISSSGSGSSSSGSSSNGSDSKIDVGRQKHHTELAEEDLGGSQNRGASTPLGMDTAKCYRSASSVAKFSSRLLNLQQQQQQQTGDGSE
ncbi:protein rtoA-like [Procambarus clarkii]|uniref:protein rtoA-like n=1 Tax=Procambarus clarkii TaxID=6728 RepID=UPI0037442AC5